jgi:hypothetical protein
VIARDADQVRQHRPPDAGAARCLRRVHRLEFAMQVVKPLQRTDSQQFAVAPAGVEGDSWLEQAGDIEREDAARRAQRRHLVQMLSEQLADVRGTRVFDSDQLSGHGFNLRPGRPDCRADRDHQGNWRMTGSAPGESCAAAGAPARQPRLAQL